MLTQRRKIFNYLDFFDFSGKIIKFFMSPSLKTTSFSLDLGTSKVKFENKLISAKSTELPVPTWQTRRTQK